MMKFSDLINHFTIFIRIVAIKTLAKPKPSRGKLNSSLSLVKPFVNSKFKFNTLCFLLDGWLTPTVLLLFDMFIHKLHAQAFLSFHCVCFEGFQKCLQHRFNFTFLDVSFPFLFSTSKTQLPHFSGKKILELLHFYTWFRIYKAMNRSLKVRLVLRMKN